MSALVVLYITALILVHLITGSGYPLTSYSNSSCPHALPLVTTNLISFSMSFFFFYDCTYKWAHTLFVFIWLLSFSITPSRSIHVVIHRQISFFCLFVFGCPEAELLGRGSDPIQQPWTKPQLWQRQILNPLCQAGDRTCIPVLLRCCWFCCATAGAPHSFFKWLSNIHWESIAHFL